MECCMLYVRAQALMKSRLKGAQKGHSLLKKKSDALTAKFRSLLKHIVEVDHLHHPFSHDRIT